jgi:hypothetical protein
VYIDEYVVYASCFVCIMIERRREGFRGGLNYNAQQERLEAKEGGGETGLD